MSSVKYTHSPQQHALASLYLIVGIVPVESYPSRLRFRQASILKIVQLKMYTTEPTIKMLRSEKNFILSQVASVLSELQCLVSKLNSVQCEDEEESMSDVTNISWDSSQDFPVY